MINQDLVHQDFQLFTNQVGGHCLFIKKIKSNQVLKPVIQKELNFYLYVSNIQNESIRKLSQFLTNFLGEELVNKDLINFSIEDPKMQGWMEHLKKKRFNITSLQYIKLEDLTSHLLYPCILDLKIGRGKHQSEVQKQMTTLGFRICGMKINKPDHMQIFKDKFWGRSLTLNQTKQTIAMFLYDPQSKNINKQLAKQIIEKLQELTDAIKENSQFRWISSSLLIIYEGDRGILFKLKLIDFANVEIIEEGNDEYDKEMTDSILNLIDLLKQVEEIEDFEIQSFI